MDGVQPGFAESVVDRLPPDAQLPELSARDHPMLPARQLGDRGVDAVRAHFASHDEAK
jgi:hypothetical protein